MAVKLRLSRVGKTNRPIYRIIAIDEHKKRDGKHVEILGTYDPFAETSKVVLKKGRINYWLSVGAKPTKTVATFLS